MIGHLNASLEGLTTVRACRAENILEEEFDRHQDLYTSALYMSTCSMKAFGLTIDTLCSIIITLVIAGFIFSDSEVSAGYVGLAVMHVLQLGEVVQYGYQNLTQLENLMTSAERVLEYRQVKSETAVGHVLENWPSHGAVTFEKVSLSYHNEQVLKNVSFKIEPQQKIAIIGRTGAGKSSLISSLFRLYDTEGKILIDGVDIKSLSLKFLRRKLAVIPQESILFTGTLRSNLDPFNEFSDEDLWAALEKVHMKKSVDQLGMAVKSHGANFSIGQIQLIFLARAILNKTKIIITDEATDCTVFQISHRLKDTLECDKILVMERGEIKEFGDTTALLQDERGHYYNLLKQAGLLDNLNKG
ncbi:hypothetical protein JTB14_013819 [Gonioctena quinquepunctata]|nr:hypothetical protein JTB14_013819 [Gonioctena quinquepunctata]